MKRLALALWLLLCAPLAFAYDCLPAGWIPTPLATGGQALGATTPAGEALAWWCLLPSTDADVAAGKVEYAPQFFVILAKYKAPVTYAAAVARIAAASDPVAQTRTELANAAVTPPAGTQDRYDFDLLRFMACQALATKPYLAPVDDLPANWCGAAPVPPAPPAGTWLVAKQPGQTTRPAFSVTAGVLTQVSSPRAVVGAQCDCTAPIAKNGLNYCLFAQSVGLVTVCTKQ